MKFTSQLKGEKMRSSEGDREKGKECSVTTTGLCGTSQDKTSAGLGEQNAGSICNYLYL